MRHNAEAFRPLKAFNDRAAKPPGRWQQVLAVVLAILLPAALWDERGALVGIVAFLVYGGVFLVAAFKHDDLLAWSRRHPALDSLIIVPLAFLALAYLTDLGSGLCAAISAAAGLILVSVAGWRRQARRRPA